ncbi:MAG: hypothetical protein KAT26_13315, partial [Marinosulfonomonas sp.]|nr:hypothetical protein [Marinosulfonomonas sp.]
PAEVKPPEPVETAPVSVKEHLPLITHLPRQPTKPRVGIFADSDVSTAKTMQELTDRITEMQSEMLRQIGHAASQGLLDANLPQIIQEEPDTDEPLVVAQKEDPATQPHVNIHIESSVDREFVNMLPTNLMTGDGAECLPDELFNVVEWGDPDAVFDQIVVQRSRISGEFDKVDQQAVAALVRAYIYAGFGVEAMSALNAFDVTLQDAGVLTTMAQIVDGPLSAHGSALDGQVGCDSAVALWSALAALKLSKGMEINHTSVLGAFSSLPFHLRRHLGPRLSQKFLDIGDIETARALRNAIARAPGDAGPEFRLLDARLDQARGMHGTAEQAMEEIIAEGSGVAPRALVELLEAKLEQKAEINQNLLVVAQSYIFEQQHTEIGANLTRVVALAHAKSGDLPAALEMMRKMELSGHFNAMETGQAWEKVLNFAVNEALNESFLQFAFAAQDDLENQQIARDIRRKAAGRLLDGHFAKMAQKLLAAPAAPTADDRMLLARAAIIENEAEYAIAILEHVSGNEAARLRAHAYEMRGKHLDAAHEYGSIRDQGSQHNAFWRAGDWQRLGDIGSGPEKDAAQIMMAQDPMPAKSDGIIAQDKSLLEASTTTRQSIEALLEEYPAPAQEGS